LSVARWPDGRIDHALCSAQVIAISEVIPDDRGGAWVQRAGLAARLGWRCGGEEGEGREEEKEVGAWRSHAVGRVKKGGLEAAFFVRRLSATLVCR
jgi:hypothetical protein